MRKFSKVYQSVVVFILVLVGLTIGAFAQPTLHRTTATSEELQKHDLAWIKSKNDFDQSKFTEVQAETEIAYIIKKIGLELPGTPEGEYNDRIVTIETPFNVKKLKYWGLCASQRH